MDWDGWQRSWDTQQQAFMPDREERFAAMLDVVEAVEPRAPRVLDLACGTGSISRRLFERLPGARSTLLDLDPALLRIAEGSFEGDERVTIVRADLGTPEWRTRVGVSGEDGPGEGGFDAVLTATALHWIPDERLRTLYAEIAGVLRPGGVFCNADHMPDPGLPTLTARVGELRDARREASYRASTALSWSAWWDRARSAPELAELVAERDRIYGTGGHDHGLPNVTRHLDFLRAAGFGEVGLVWRGLGDAAFAAVR